MDLRGPRVPHTRCDRYCFVLPDEANFHLVGPLRPEVWCDCKAMGKGRLLPTESWLMSVSSRQQSTIGSIACCAVEPFRPAGFGTLHNFNTRNKKLLGTKGIATRSKDASSSSWPYY